MSGLSKKQIALIVAIGLVFVIVILCYLYKVYNEGEEDADFDVEISNDVNYEQSIGESGKVVVHIAGEVNSPGIIEADANSRIADIVEKAEGLTEYANIDNVNLAYVVQDGQKIVIPSVEDEVGENEEYITSGAGDGIVEGEVSIGNGEIDVVNINTATQTQLEQLPGIGPSTALKIIDYRKSNGRFNSIDDIKNVSGIGDAKFEKIKDYIVAK